MILGFKDRFKSKIVEGTKIHTIREDPGNRWIAGKKIHFATGVRTKHYNQFKAGKCISIQQIEIIRHSNLDRTKIFVDGRQLTAKEIQQLAWNDGFSCVVDFFLWFCNDFKGKIIHWTDLKY